MNGEWYARQRHYSSENILSDQRSIRDLLKMIARAISWFCHEPNIFENLVDFRRRSITNSLETMKKIREEEEAQVARHVREMVMVNEGILSSRNPVSFQGHVPQTAQIPPWAQLPSHALALESETIGLFGTRQMALDEPKATTSTFKESPAKQPRKRKCRYQSKSKI